MAPRSPQEKESRAMQRRAAWLDGRDLLYRITRAIAERRPQAELDALRLEAAEFLAQHPRNL